MCMYQFTPWTILLNFQFNIVIQIKNIMLSELRVVSNGPTPCKVQQFQ